jgi:hypothetical protein
VVFAVLRASGVLAQSDVGQFDPTLRADSRLIGSAAVVGRTGVADQFGMVVRGATPTFDKRFLIGTVHSLMMTCSATRFDTVQLVNIFSLNRRAE